MNWSILIGALLVLFGLSLILKTAFNIDIPLARIVVALFLIYLGIRMFVGRDFGFISHRHDENTVVFGQRTFSDITGDREYNVVFGKGILDLRNIDPADSQKISIRLNTVFGSSDVLYKDTIPLKIRATAAFAGVKLPTGNTESFGTFEFSSGHSDTGPSVTIESNTVFGGTLYRRF